MIDFFLQQNPVVQALLAGCFTWGITALGAATVFFAKEINAKILGGMLGFAAGVMVAASFWSLLAPAIELAGESSVPAWIPAATGFFFGGIFLRGLDIMLPHLHPGFPVDKVEGPETSFHKTSLLIIAITMHNIPEGLAVGVAFGAVAAGFPTASVAAAIALTVGIGIQNFPEGLAVSIPLRGEGFSRARSFWYGQLSGVVEPIAAMIGAATVLFMRFLLPYALAFAAGAMIFVVVEEVIPQSQMHGKTDIATMGVLTGFVAMMVLDVAFG